VKHSFNEFEVAAAQHCTAQYSTAKQSTALEVAIMFISLVTTISLFQDM
jgi:hypothetical protein